PNPAGSVWVFIGLSELFGATSPVELARIGQWMNAIALLGLAFYAWRIVPMESRGVWCWAAVLAAVNPLAVLMQRKIWPPSIAPLLLLGVVIGWRNRDRRWGAALWGFLALAVGQVHLAGLFLAGGLTLWTLAFDRRGTRWWAWAIGSAAAAWPLAFWLRTAFDQAIAEPTGQIRLSNAATLNFFLRWVSEPFGMSLSYSIEEEFDDFLRFPLVNGRATYLVGALHVAMYALMAWFALSAIWRAWRQRRAWRDIVPGSRDSHWFGINAVMLGYGGLITLACVPTQRHYMLMTFPMMYLWVAAIALSDRRPVKGSKPISAGEERRAQPDLQEPSIGRDVPDIHSRAVPDIDFGRSPRTSVAPHFTITRGQALLAALALVQFATSALFLDYVHGAQRTLRGDYGTPYSVQVRNGLEPF
ncbi:MAG TPA: hypothetical protein VGI99_04090, partial [Gemmataceae bacterium]